MLQNKAIAIIGSGIMAEAMIKGFLRKGNISAEQVVASGPRASRGQELRDRYGVGSTSDNVGAAKDRDIIILAVKPQVLDEVLSELGSRLPASALVLSIVAGAPIEKVRVGLGHSSIVRAMPNTPGQIGEGITVWTATDSVTDEQLDYTREILGALGETIFVDHENALDMATALSGTGPAYVLLFMEAMIDAGVHLGFSRRISERLVVQTMRGTVEYARQSPRHPATLRNEVTSPGGTSAEALYHLEKGGLRTVVSRSIWAAYQRSIMLGAAGASQQPSGHPLDLD